MMRVWCSLALLSASWLFGVTYYHDAVLWIWFLLVVIGSVLLWGIPMPRLSTGTKVTGALFMLPAVLLLPWPYRAGPLLAGLGLLLAMPLAPRRWPRTCGAACIASGVVLTIQSLALYAYIGQTARSHELPLWLARLVYGVARVMGVDAALDGTSLCLFTMREVHRLGMTWEFFFDPVSMLFLVGSFILFTFFFRARAKAVFAACLGIGVWQCLRAGVLVALLVHRALLTEYDEPLALISLFWSPWSHLVLLIGPVLLMWHFVTFEPLADTEKLLMPTRHLRPVLLAGLGAGVLVWGWHYAPQGQRKAGRVFVDEHHSQWERTDRPFDTEWYGNDSGYNYACLYDYLSRYYTMSRIESRLTANRLSECDVLVVKMPTERYGTDEIQVIKTFVEQGGGLLLVGEHTNVFNTSTYLNDISQSFGFVFRDDCLFDMDSPFEQYYVPPLIPHPVVQHMPPMDFAVSCSIDPGHSRGKAVICSTGLKSLPAEYHVSNFYPQVEDRVLMRYGAFIQLWAQDVGRGRVLAFTDSTIYSNFAAFEPGKPELMLGMIEWLNHVRGPFNVTPWLLGLGVGLSVTGLYRRVKIRSVRLPVFCAAVFGASLGIVTVKAVNRQELTLPQAERPFVRVVMDRTLCRGPLSKSGFIAGRDNGFGIFERWILRLGYFTTRRRDSEAFDGDLLVFCYPTETVTAVFRQQFLEYLESGGHALILDDPDNTHSTTNSLLYPLGVSINSQSRLAGTLENNQGWPTASPKSAYPVEGGEPLVYLQGRPVAAQLGYGSGTVTVLGFGSLFSDAAMGVTGDVVPDQQLRQVFDLEYALIRYLCETENEALRQNRIHSPAPPP